MATDAVVVANYSRVMAGLKPLLLLVGVAAAVAAGVSVVLWSRGPSYSLLYANLAAEDEAQITQALDAANIPYRLEPGTNALQVPAERVADARLKLAGQGLPEGDGGFASMAKDPGFGQSQFMEGARYQHAIESELARTISSLRPIASARVHLAVPTQSAFVRDRRPATASVFVELKTGRRLEQEQVQAILNLVASSIPELDANHVTVVDQAGRLLSSPQGSDDAAQRAQHFEQEHRLEEEYAQRVEALLTPLVGPGRVRAQVVADLDSSVTEESHEQYRPDSQIVRSEQDSVQSSRDGANSGGIPGALSNQPPAGGVAQPPAPAAAATPAAAAPKPGTPAAAAAAAAAATAAAAAAAAVPESNSHQSTKNYEIDRTLAYTRRPGGTIQRLSVAVLIDNVRTTGKDGKVHETPLSAAQIDHVTSLVKDAVGFDAKRGDTVNVVNASFSGEVTEVATGTPSEAIPIWEQPLAQNLAKLLAGMIVLIVLVLTVLRPLVRALINPVRAVAELAAPEPPPESGRALTGGGQQLAYEQQLAQARTLVSQDPKRVAQVVRSWVGEDEPA